MKPPIIINDNPDPNKSGDVTVYRTVHLAELSLESYDAGDPSLTIFDAEGQVLQMTLDGDIVRIEESKAKQTDSALLRFVLLDFFLRVGYNKLGLSKDWSEKATLSDLVDKACELLANENA